MNILFIADTHGTFREKEVENLEIPELVVLLGDHSYRDLEIITNLFKDVRIIGILGNHDEKDLYDDFPMIEHINEKLVVINGIRFLGLSGSLKYKNKSNIFLYTQAEAKEILESLPPCDILLTHDKANYDREYNDIDEVIETGWWIFKKKKIISHRQFYYSDKLSSNAHMGLTAIGDYILTKQPRYHFFGHLHEPNEFCTKNTKEECIYRCKLINI